MMNQLMTSRWRHNDVTWSLNEFVAPVNEYWIRMDSTNANLFISEIIWRHCYVTLIYDPNTQTEYNELSVDPWSV